MRAAALLSLPNPAQAVTFLVSYQCHRGSTAQLSKTGSD
jgi:hypothetical protein